MALQGIVRTAWKAVEPAAPGITTIVLVVPDSFPPLRWAGMRALGRPSTILPVALGGHACVAILPVTATLLRQDVTLQALGPCAYYAQYGAPGPAVSKWLEWQSFETAAAFDWSGGALPSTLSSSAHRPSFSAPGADPAQLPDFNAPWTESTAGLRCRAGNLQSCGVALLTPSAPPYPYFTGLEESRPTPGFRVWDYYGPSLNGFGEIQRGWLSDLVRTMGKERVGRFWRSQKPVDQAFADAMGMPIAEWTRDWVVAREGAIAPGPQVPISSALSSFGLAALLATLGLYRAGRRQVG
jgi:hypothetical protein